MTRLSPTEQRGYPLFSSTWIPLSTVLVLTTYVVGVALAQRWVVPALMPPAPTMPPSPVPADWLTPGDLVEGVLDAGAGREYQFLGYAGQAATLEMWFHPGSGSSVEAELAVSLVDPSGDVLASERGDVFLPPYLVASRMPATGLYRVRVAPTSGAPGRYSFILSLLQPSEPSTAGTPASTPHVEDAATAAQAMFRWPSTRREISGWTFHDPGNPAHNGLDIAAAMHDPIRAVADGIVVFAGWGGGYGNLIIVAHGGDWISYYAHLDEFAVKEGDEVRQQEVLGGAGTTGYSTGPHLHFELRYRGRPVDPHVYLP
jgi:murein DD-endopeptidase MepM/ murein hydrolase activator NlpD